MAPKVVQRAGPISQILVRLMRFRSLKYCPDPVESLMRHPSDMAKRSIPQPSLPDGPSHRIKENYYYNRDARRAVMPPKTIYRSREFNEPLQITSGGGEASPTGIEGEHLPSPHLAAKLPPTPGKVHNFDACEFSYSARLPSEHWERKEPVARNLGGRYREY